MEDCWLTIWEIATEIGISNASADTILTDDLAIYSEAMKVLPKLLLVKRKSSVWTLYRIYWGLSVVILTSWWLWSLVMSVGCTSTMQKLRLGYCSGVSIIPRLKESNTMRRKVKLMFTGFLTTSEVVHRKYTQANCYIKCKLLTNIVIKWFSVNFVMEIGTKNWACVQWHNSLLLHVNASFNCLHLIQYFLARHGIPQDHQVSCCPDMASCDLFPKLKMLLKGSWFESQ